MDYYLIWKYMLLNECTVMIEMDLVVLLSVVT